VSLISLGIIGLTRKNRLIENKSVFSAPASPFDHQIREPRMAALGQAGATGASSGQPRQKVREQNVAIFSDQPRLRQTPESATWFASDHERIGRVIGDSQSSISHDGKVRT
jgi:hypothetical protein